jgi:hypothetical protein
MYLGKMRAQNVVKGIKSTRKSGYSTYRGWAEIGYENEQYNIDRKEEGT